MADYASHSCRRPIPTGFSEALNDLPEDDALQLCELGFHYAEQGDEDFRSRLYQIVQEQPFLIHDTLVKKRSSDSMATKHSFLP